MGIYPTLILFGIFLLAVFLVWAEGLLRRVSTVLIFLGILLSAFLLRLVCMNHETLDFLDFLSVWVQFFRENGGFSALESSPGNYNVPYLYFLALFSYSGIGELYLIKLLSILFDVIMAWACMRLAGLYTPRSGRRLFAFLGVLLLPTVILNGALWGQCDSIYTAFGILAVYQALNDKPVLSLIFAALSLAFKLQAVFFLPLYFVLLYTGRVKWRQLVFFPLGYVASILPAVLLGRPFWDTLTLYLHTADTAGSGLNYNSPSLFTFIRNGADAELYAMLGITAAFVFCAAVLGWLCASGRRLNREALLGSFLLLLIGVPLLLPHMHDRYFYGADVLSLAFAFVVPRLWTVPVFCSFASLLCYHAYLKQSFLLPLRYGTWALLAASVLLIAYICERLYSRDGTRRELRS